jgi:hypothetical protein
VKPRCQKRRKSLSVSAVRTGEVSIRKRKEKHDDEGNPIVLENVGLGTENKERVEATTEEGWDPQPSVRWEDEPSWEGSTYEVHNLEDGDQDDGEPGSKAWVAHGDVEAEERENRQSDEEGEECLLVIANNKIK